MSTAKKRGEVIFFWKFSFLRVSCWTHFRLKLMGKKRKGFLICFLSLSHFNLSLMVARQFSTLIRRERETERGRERERERGREKRGPLSNFEQYRRLSSERGEGRRRIITKHCANCKDERRRRKRRRRRRRRRRKKPLMNFRKEGRKEREDFISASAFRSYNNDNFVLCSR